MIAVDESLYVYSPSGEPWDIVCDVSTVRLMLVALGPAVYAGLAILGWGGFRGFFSHRALIALVIALFGMSGVALSPAAI
jgi:hypothetical protein